MFRRAIHSVVLATLVAAALIPQAAPASEPIRVPIVSAQFMYVPALDVYRGGDLKARVEMRIKAGMGLQYRNLDSEAHNIVSGEPNENYPVGTGLFWACEFRSEEACTGVEQNQEWMPVEGVEFLPPGDYPFYCSKHQGIPSGVLEIV